MKWEDNEEIEMVGFRLRLAEDPEIGFLQRLDFYFEFLSLWAYDKDILARSVTKWESDIVPASRQLSCNEELSRPLRVIL